MAYTKVSDLTALTSPDGAEELLINDGGTSKKITIDNLLYDESIDSDQYVDGSIDTAHIADDAVTADKLADAINTSIAAKLPLAGGTMTGDIAFGDSIEAKFGASNDLVISHNGSNSYIEDTGTGDLFLTATTIRLKHRDSSPDDNMLLCNANGSVDIYYDNALKLATTSTGIDVTGTVNVNGDGNDLIVNSADYELVLLGNRGSTGTNLDKGYLRMKSEGINTIVLDTDADSYFNGGNVGIGDTDPSEAKLSIDNVLTGDSGLKVVRNLDEAGSNPLVYIVDDHTANTQPALSIQQDGAGYGLQIDQNGNEDALYIDSEATSNYGIKVYSKYGIYSNQDISSGRAARFTRDLDEAGSYPLVQIIDGHTSNTQPALSIQQEGAGYGLFIDQNGNARAIYIDSEATSESVIVVAADVLTTGKAAYFYSNSVTTDTRNLVEIHNDHASATGTTGLYVKQDSTGAAAVFDGGNVGIGATPESWISTYSTLQMGDSLALSARTTEDTVNLSNNAYADSVDSRWEYIGANGSSEAALLILDSNGKFVFRTAPAGAADAEITWTTAMTIANDGDVTVGTGNLVIGTAGKGIDFSAQTATATGTTTSEVLDHYEEGTWTPALRGTTGTAGTWTQGTYTAKYVKIGNVVHINIEVYLTDLGSYTGYTYITGLPFTNTGGSTAISLSCFPDILGSADVAAQVTSDVADIRFYTGAKTDVAHAYADMTTGAYCNAAGTYLA